MLSGCGDDLVVKQILYIKAKTKSTVSVMAGLLMVGTVFSLVMLWRDRIVETVALTVSDILSGVRPIETLTKAYNVG